MATPPKLLLVDGSGYIFRAFHALPMMNRSDGLPTNAVRGFMSMLLKLRDTTPCDAIAVIFDASSKTFRNEIYADYKAHRPPPPEELIPQFALVREAAQAMNIACLEQHGFEADDLIATYSKMAHAQGYDVTVVSSDKDLMQLVNPGEEGEPGVRMYDPMKDNRIGLNEVMAKFGVGPERVTHVQALAGDSVDNIPGVPGIGLKTAAQLINDYGDLETLLEQASAIKQPKRRQNLLEHAEAARMSFELVRLKDDVDVAMPLEDFTCKEPVPEVLTDFLQKMEFKTIAERLGLSIEVQSRAPAKTDDGPALGSCEYALVTSLTDLESWISRARAARRFAFDTETTSLDAMQAKLVGVSIAVAPGEACYIPFAHRGSVEGELELADEVPDQIALEQALPLLKDLLEDPSILKIGHNMKYDWLILKRLGITIAPIDDTMLMSYVLEGGLHGHGMDELSKRFFEHAPIPFSAVAGTGKNKRTFDQVPLDQACDYAAEDADITLRFWALLKPRLPKEALTTLYETIERPLISVLTTMEHTGIKVDRERLHDISTRLAKRSADLETEIYALAGETFTIGSPKQLGEILFGKMGLEGGKKNKSGAYSTDASVLETLSGQGHDLPFKVLAWRQVNKLKSTYTDALQTQINPETGRVHTSFAMAAASTGRLASTDPNLQNIPIRTEEGREIREAFVAEPGHVLLSVDYSQIELRITAHMAEEAALKQAFHDGLDIHAMTASQVFGVPLEGMDPMIRRQAKAINFGIIYGISAFGLANNLRIPQGEARDFIKAYFERFPGIKGYMDNTKKSAKDTGIVTTLFGRKIHLPGIEDRNGARRAFSERAAINAPIQGTAADIIKRAMIRMPKALRDAGLKAKMLLQVHDELLFEVPEDALEQTIAVTREVMEQATTPVLNLSVPLIADAGHGMSWAEAH